MLQFLPILGSIIQGFGASKAANAQSDASANDLAFQKMMFDMIRGDLSGWKQGGQAANAGLMFELGLGPKPEGYGGYTASKGYGARLQEGQNALQSSAAAKGGLYSGATMGALQKQGQDYATADYGNYINSLMGLSNQGMSAAQMTGSAGQNTAAGVSNALSNQGNAQAAGYVGMGNAFNSGLNDYAGVMGYQNQLASQYPTAQAPKVNGGYTFNPFYG